MDCGTIRLYALTHPFAHGDHWATCPLTHAYQYCTEQFVRALTLDQSCSRHHPCTSAIRSDQPQAGLRSQLGSGYLQGAGVLNQPLIKNTHSGTSDYSVFGSDFNQELGLLIKGTRIEQCCLILLNELVSTRNNWATLLVDKPENTDRLYLELHSNSAPANVALLNSITRKINRCAEHLYVLLVQHCKPSANDKTAEQNLSRECAKFSRLNHLAIKIWLYCKKHDQPTTRLPSINALESVVTYLKNSKEQPLTPKPTAGNRHTSEVSMAELSVANQPSKTVSRQPLKQTAISTQQLEVLDKEHHPRKIIRDKLLATLSVSGEEFRVDDLSLEGLRIAGVINNAATPLKAQLIIPRPHLTQSFSLTLLPIWEKKEQSTSGYKITSLSNDEKVSLNQHLKASRKEVASLERNSNQPQKKRSNRWLASHLLFLSSIHKRTRHLLVVGASITLGFLVGIALSNS